MKNLSGRLFEGERITGTLKHQAKKIISEIDFDVSWDVDFNLPLIDLEADPSVLSQLNTGKLIEEKFKRLLQS